MTPGATADPGAVPPIPMTCGGSEVDGPVTGPGAPFLSAPNPVSVRLREDSFRSYDLATLGDVVTRTVRDTQQRARTAFERAVAQIEPAEFTVTETGLRRVRPE